MKYLLLLITVYVMGCNNDDLLCIPACMADIISQFSCDETASITEYKFQGSRVYYLDPGFCADDQHYDVINSKCEVLGYLGGIAGNAEINGEDFFENAVFVGVVWKR